MEQHALSSDNLPHVSETPCLMNKIARGCLYVTLSGILGLVEMQLHQQTFYVPVISRRFMYQECNIFKFASNFTDIHKLYPIKIVSKILGLM